MTDSMHHRWWLAGIVLAGALLRVALAFYFGNVVEPIPAAYDQIFYHDVALNLLAGRGFTFTRPPWPFIQPGAPTAYIPFLYELFLAAIYKIAGAYPVIARIVQALLCSLMPWFVYTLVRRILAGSAAWGKRAAAISLTAAAITAFYAYFIFYSAALMTEGLYLLMVSVSLLATWRLAEAPSGRRWLLWGATLGLTILMRQVFMPVSALLFLYVLWRGRPRIRVVHIAAAVAVIAALILPWTVRNYRVFGRFLLLNSQAGQVFWNANHPDLGSRFEGAPMFPIPADLAGANEAVLDSELMKRGWQNVAADPVRFLRLTLSRIPVYFKFWPSSKSSLLSNIGRTLSAGLFLPFMAIGLVLSVREWRRWILSYAFILGYTFIHLITWPQLRYRMPVDLALVPFAALTLVALAGLLTRGASAGLNPAPESETSLETALCSMW